MADLNILISNIATEISNNLGLAVAISALLVVLAALFTFLAVSFALRGSKRDAIVLLGPCGAGKTALYFQLRDGSTHEGTVSSMESNEGRFALFQELEKKPKAAKAVHLVDVPGHPRLRAKVEEALGQARALVFVIDALDFMPNLRQNAQFIYDVLRKRTVAQRRIPILVACNKTDKVTAHSVDFIRKQLEKEIDKLRSARAWGGAATSAAHTDVDEALGDDVATLGSPGEAFRFQQCSNPISFAAVSALLGNVEELAAFINTHF